MCARAGKEKRDFKKDGWLVKVQEERLTVFGAAWYQLHHATIRYGIKRFHAVNWFGKLRNCAFRSEYKKNEGIECGDCDELAVKDVYVGRDFLVSSLGSRGYRKFEYRDRFEKNGNPNFASDIAAGGTLKKRERSVDGEVVYHG